MLQGLQGFWNIRFWCCQGSSGHCHGEREHQTNLLQQEQPCSPEGEGLEVLNQGNLSRELNTPTFQKHGTGQSPDVCS